MFEEPQSQQKVILSPFQFLRGKPKIIAIFKLPDVSNSEVTERTIKCKYSSFNGPTMFNAY